VLELTTLGSLAIQRDGELVTGLATRKVEALLVYLACTHRPHAREFLAELFWAERPTERALGNLRVALTSLRRHLGAYLVITRDNVSMAPGADVQLDVAELEGCLAAGQAKKAVALYQGEFLAGFSVRGSSAFDDWASLERERLHRTVIDALGELVAVHLGAGIYPEGIAHARRLLLLDPWQEAAHRQLMRLLAYSGQRGAALAQYETCRQVLADELGMEPEQETTRLYKQIQAGELERPATLSETPSDAPSSETQTTQRRIATVLASRGYELRERVGAGGFGEVYRAFQPAVGRDVAIKVIMPQHAQDPEFVQRFETEARLVARLEHPHIVPLYDFWQGPDGAYLVMRWLRGGNLYQALQQGPWELEPATRLLEQVAGALDRAHQQGVVHRDVKPENIVLDEHGHAYLSDFGIAKDLMRRTMAQTGGLTGSLLYMAPEQVRGQSASPQGDQYSLGVVMYEALCGEYPFDTANPAFLFHEIMTKPLPALGKRRPDLPPALDAVLQQAAAKDPAQRFPGTVAFAEAFVAALGPALIGVATGIGAPEKLPAEPALRLPGFLEEEGGASEGVSEDVGPRAVPPTFVARERELARLDGFLQAAVGGQGQAFFITGGAGRGKTALLGEFARRAVTAHPDLLVACGNCNAYSGMGDPYLPFREVLAMLTGDVEARWAAGTITRDHARRLWMAMPAVVDALLDRGPDAIGVLLRGASLLGRARAAAPGGAPWLRRLEDVVEGQPARAGRLEQGHLFQQITDMLRHLAGEHPLLLVLDDLQWVDTASIGLLFHLGRRLQGSRILIAAAYRPEELALGRVGARYGVRERHPLEKALAEFKRMLGDVWLDLAGVEEQEGQRFVQALLETEPHRLSQEFPEALFRQTGGHPLFTVELLRAMQERGDLVRDETGRWVEAASLDWQTLPARVEGVIEERVGRLSEELQELLTLAAVQGERFVAQVVARVAGRDERQIIGWLSQDLGQRHRLVAEEGIESLNGQRLFRYRFRHALFQQYLCSRLSPIERELLHADVGTVLEELYAGRTDEIALQLARHWLEAAQEERAIPYLLQAGDQARAVYAHAEAEQMYLQAVEILQASGRDELAARTLMKLGLVYTAAFEPEKAQETYEQAFGLWEPLRASRSLDPSLVGDDASTFMTSQLFEGLVRVGPDHNVLPAVAARWEIADGGTRYLFHLRNNVRWSDGTPVTASDFFYAWTRNLDPATRSPVAHLLYPIRNARAFGEGELDDPAQVGVVAADDRTLEVTLERPIAYLPDLLAHRAAYPLPRWAVEGQGQAWTEPGHLVSNGPYELLEWQRGECLVLGRNPFYQGSFPGNAERVECLVYDDYELALAAYAADRVDALSLINADPSTIAHARATHGRELVSSPWPITLYLLFRVDEPPFDDPRVRRAFGYAVDLERLAREAFPDQRLPATGGFVPPGMPGHSPGIGLAYDPDLARRLLAEAGYADGQGFPPVRWLHASGSTEEQVVPFLRASWRRNLALDLEAHNLEWKELLQQLLKDPPHMHMLGWSADYRDPDNFLHVVFHSGEGINDPRWHNARFDALVEEAARVRDQERRMALYREADRILVAEEAVIMPLSYGQWHMLAKPWITLPDTVSVTMPFKTIVVEGRSDLPGS
jgi:ABC-type oligopeptide transport system substrate-binding subunit/DNA-binding SARP family transcriptional activator